MDLKNLLEEKAHQYNNPNFIERDPISIPHRYTKRQDIEISAFLCATLAWGRRDIILTKCNHLLKLMNNAPHEFVLNFTHNDLVKLQEFKHRTFSSSDLVYFLRFLQSYYRQNDSLEGAFAMAINKQDHSTENALTGFHQLFFSLDDLPKSTLRHISTPKNKSACKRLSMFLRWMVRKDGNGVDFGLWNDIKPHQLVVPCDVHVHTVSKKLGLTARNNLDWKAALEITKELKKMDPDDPIKYDFALFSIGAERDLL
jgi:uncharacterized protein (TIGR02757 family)